MIRDLKTAEIYFLLFIIYSFGGWLIEEVNCSIREKKIVNRGFLIGPVCPIYGVGAVVMTKFLTKYYNDPFVLFCMAIIACGFVEYMTSYIMEKIFKARWWDYSKRKFNLNGRVCAGTILPFGIFGLIIIYFSNPIFVSWLNGLSNMCLNILTFILTVIILADTEISFLLISKVRQKAKDISEANKKDNTNEITEKVKEEINKEFMGKRLINAFPQLQTFRKKVKEVANQVVEKQGTAIENKVKKVTEVANKNITKSKQKLLKKKYCKKKIDTVK